MIKFYEVLKETIDNKVFCVLVTIIQSQGSTPREVGAKMLVDKNGLLIGTVGGGNIEFQAIRKAKEVLTTQQTETVTYVLNNSKASNLGMICGGETTLLYKFINYKDETANNAINSVLKGLRHGYEGYLIQSYINNQLEYSLDEKKLSHELCYFEKIHAPSKVLIFGGGHVAQALVPVLANLNFNCTVLEDRSEFLHKNLFKLAKELVLVDYDHLNYPVTEYDYCVIVTRGHLHDLVVEKYLLNTLTEYIGVMGSRHKTARHRQILLEEGFSEEQLQRIYAPIGLAIKAKTPEEISISIAGELIKIRAEKFEVQP